MQLTCGEIQKTAQGDPGLFLLKREGWADHEGLTYAFLDDNDDPHPPGNTRSNRAKTITILNFIASKGK